MKRPGTLYMCVRVCVYGLEIIKIPSTDTIIIDVDLAAKYCARVHFIFRVILRKIPRNYPSPAAFSGVYPFVIFPRNFISGPRIFLSVRPAAKVLSLQFNHAAFLLYRSAIREVPRFASSVSLLYVRRWVYEFYNGSVKLLLCLWHVYFMGR